MLAMLALIKFVASILGPEGLAELGLFISLSSILMVFSGGGIANAITKYVAEYREFPAQLNRFLGCASLYGGAYSTLILGFSILFASVVAKKVLGDVDLYWLVPVYGFAHAIAFVGTMTTSVANGLGRQDIAAFITISASVITIAASFALISQIGLIGGALAIALIVASVGLVSAAVAFGSRLSRFMRFRYCNKTFSRLLKYSLMAFSSAMLFPLTETIIRSQIIDAMGLEIAGFWQGLIRLSGAYLGFFSVLLASIFMPTLSRVSCLETCRRLVLAKVLQLGCCFFCFAIFLIVLREYLIPIVFSQEFFPISQIMHWQLLGDFFRVCSYVIGFLLVAKSRTALYIFGEFFQFTLYLAITLFIVYIEGTFENLAQGYAVSYAIFFTFSLVILFYSTHIRSK